MWILDFLNGLPKELVVGILAALPISEVRGSVPIGIIQLGLPPIKVLIISICASLLPVFPILWFLGAFTEKLRKIKFFDKFFDWLFKRTRSRSTVVEKFEVLGLIVFVAIPFPTTGIWTGCVAAYLFGLPWKHAFFATAVGTTIASVLMLGFSVGVITLW